MVRSKVMRRQRRIVRAAVAVLTLAMLVLSGCGGDQSGAAEVVDRVEDPPSEAPAGAVDAPPSDTAPPSEGASDAGAGGRADLPRSTTYGGMEWTVEDATEADGQVMLDVTVVDTVDERRSQDEVAVDDLSLLDANGVAMNPTPPIDSGAEELKLDMTAGGRDQGTLAFEVDDGFALGAASFQIATPDSEPAVIPLGGEQPENPYPIEVDISAEAKQASVQGPESTASGPAAAMYEPLTATVALDIGPTRVLEGHRWLLVTLNVASEHQHQVTFNDRAVHLLANGEVLDAVPGGFSSESINEGESMDLEYTFSLPLDATHVKLQVGIPGSDTKKARFPLNLPDMPPVSGPSGS